MENCFVVGTNIDKKLLNLGIGKYDSQWLTDHYGTQFRESYWVTDKDIGENDCLRIQNGKYILYKYNPIKDFLVAILYNIICYIKHGHSINYYMRMNWTIK
jgi:hypothetical protein